MSLILPFLFFFANTPFNEFNSDLKHYFTKVTEMKSNSNYYQIQCHREEFDLPKDLTVAARTESCDLSRNLESKVKYFLSFFS